MSGKAIVVEARFHSKQLVRDETDRGRHTNTRYEWIGDYEVPVVSVSGNKYEDNEQDDVLEILRVRKKFIVSLETFDETVREVRVLPKYPKHAMLVDVTDTTTSGKAILVLFFSVFFVALALPGLGMPISSFSGSDGFGAPCTDWRVMVSYSIIVGIASILVLHATIDDGQSQVALIVSGEQELPDWNETYPELQHNNGDDESTAEMTLSEEGTENELNDQHFV
eukprot:CAMPEP_0198303354 /NCGR_PEP_ID=MMETSP1449-20131203/56839_1 /TAXON_ID=420275 /ORGANISM="Attheya septentrionalis, Strain CCMP2084" /LENGTH=223 /DNA_ID=CAMNT_0044005841 /DNA_START=401 /DNA_END=1073 /DNA_ORIENTATION=+